MKQEKMHPAVIVLTCYVAALSEVDGEILAELLERSARSQKRTPAERRQLKLLAKAAKGVQAAKAKTTIENAQELGDQIAKAIVQALDDQADASE